MVVLEVSMNGHRVFTMGVGEFGALVASVTWDRIKPNLGPIYEGIRLSGRGQEADNGNYIHWPDEMLKVGDQITIKVIDSTVFDAPSERLTPEQKFAKISE